MSQINNMKVGSGREYGEGDVVINTADVLTDIETNTDAQEAILKAQMGGYGGNFISDTAAHTPATGYVFVALQAVADTVISAYSPAFGGNALTGVTLTAGTVIYGRFTTVTLTSGKLLAYQGV